MGQEELAWAAGFFDGEGSILCGYATHKKKYPYLRVTVTQAGEYAIPLLERFQQAIFNLGKIKGPFYRTIGWKPLYNWNVYGLERSQAVIAALWKYLGPCKKIQYEEQLKEYLNFHNV